MCANVFFASAPLLCPWAPSVCAGARASHQGCAPKACRASWLPAGLGGSPLPRLLISHQLQQEPAQCSGSLRNRSRGNQDEINLSKGRQLNVKFNPRASLLSVGIMLMTTAQRKTGQGEGKALPCCSTFLYTLLACSRASPNLSCPHWCSSAPVQGMCCCVSRLRRGEQLHVPHVPMHVLYASWPQRNSCTQRHRHTLCVNAHTICQHIRLYGR